MSQTSAFLGSFRYEFAMQLRRKAMWVGLAMISALLFFYIWARWTLPRYRYDQLMQFGWKILLPVAVVNLLLTAAGVLYFGL